MSFSVCHQEITTQMISIRNMNALRVAVFHNVAPSIQRHIATSRCHKARSRALMIKPIYASQGDTFTVTTPLYYVNAAPHMGSAYPTIAADVMARFHRLQGVEVRFITGTDEHGEKIALAASKRGMDPKDHCDDVVESYKRLWEDLDIAYDSFVRTTSPKHEALVSTVLEKCWENGDIYQAQYRGWYCVDCEEYKDEGDMDEDHNCPIHQKPCSEREEENYFFALSRYQSELEKLLIENHDFISPDSRRNEVLGWVKEGLRDFSISRAAVSWGIPVPRDPKQTVYVWFDALNGYLSGLYADSEQDAAKKASAEDLKKRGWPASLHVIGKDILRFHAVYWPAMLMSAGLDPPQRVFGHGFLTKDGLKMGKSLGNVLEPTALVQAYGADAVRYYFMREVVFGQDGDFSEERFRNMVNANLANDIGNLLNRTLNLLKKNCESRAPVSAIDATDSDGVGVDHRHPVRVVAEEQAPKVFEAYSSLRFHEACEAALVLSGRGNRYLEETAPWKAFKSGDDSEKASAAAGLVAVLEAVRIVAVLLSPVTPGLSRRIYKQLGFDDSTVDMLCWERDVSWGGIGAGHQFPNPVPVFERLDGEWITSPSITENGSSGNGAKDDSRKQAGTKKRGSMKSGKGPGTNADNMKASLKQGQVSQTT